MSKLELEYIKETDEYNISGLKYSVEEAETIARFIESNEFDKYVQKNPEYIEEYTQADWDREQVKADDVSDYTRDNI
tara:strand:- start:181 stop:411 length:231 start_codon:yes stop_codon:yes gene_type:complete